MKRKLRNKILTLSFCLSLLAANHAHAENYASQKVFYTPVNNDHGVYYFNPLSKDYYSYYIRFDDVVIDIIDAYTLKSEVRIALKSKK